MKPIETVKEHVRRRYVVPAREKGTSTFTVIAGSVQEELELRGHLHLVCQALQSRELLDENGLVLETTEEPLGPDATARFTYRLAAGRSATAEHRLLWQIKGAGKDMYRTLGGGEAFLRAERASFDRPRKEPKP